jgi:hypothetical protein
VAAERIADVLPSSTVEWLASEEDPAVSVLFRRHILGESDAETGETWSRRGDSGPVATILDAMRDDGSWEEPSRDYAKYGGNLWQVLFLGELWADPSDERVRRAADYAFSRQHESGAWGVRPGPSMEIQCLTANVGRSLARMGHADDDRVIAALAWIAEQHAELGHIGCKDVEVYTLNGYCHMTIPKLLLFIAEVPRELWPEGTERLREECIGALRDKQVHLSLPALHRKFAEEVGSRPKAEMREARELFVAEHAPIEYGEKQGWKRFGFPLSYNSDALEALLALAAVGEPRRAEYGPALQLVEDAADDEQRWTMRNSLNGKMIADVECKGEPSKWLTLRALTVLEHFGRMREPLESREARS